MSYEAPSRDELESLSRRVLAMSKADACRVAIDASRHSNTRFAVGEITTAGATTDMEITVTSTIGRRASSATS